MKYWHQLEPGAAIETGKHTLSAEEVLEFAQEFDPQPYHLDQEAAEASIFGGLCASGWQVNALTMRLISDALVADTFALLGVRSVNSCRWKRPLFVGDTVFASVKMNEREDDSVNPEFGLWRCDVQLSNHNHQTVLKMNTDLMLGKEPAERTA